MWSLKVYYGQSSLGWQKHFNIVLLLYGVLKELNELKDGGVIINKINMRLRGFLLVAVAILMAISYNAYAATRLSILRPTSSVTHQWMYMPLGENITQQGLKDKLYPLTYLPNVTYLQSELINIEGCDMGISVRYYVSTTDTHAIKIELVDENNNVIYSYVNDSPQLNTSTMTIGDIVKIGIINGAKKARIRVSLSDAYSADEEIYVNELELYSENGAGISDISISPLEINVEPNAMIVTSEKDSFVKIYTIDGVLIKNNAIYAGVNRIELSSGFYLVCIENKKYKIVVP